MIRSRAFLALVVAVAGCANDVDTSENRLPPPPDGAVDSGASDAAEHTGDAAVDASVDAAPPCDPGTGGCAACPNVGDWYRFTSLKVDALDGRNHPVIPVLNALWASDITRDELNVLYEVTAVRDDEVDLRVENAARMEAHDGTYCVLPSTAVDMTLKRGGCGFCMDTPRAINVYAGAQWHADPSGYVTKNCAPGLEVPNTVPIRNVRLIGHYDEGCGNVMDGTVKGAGLPKSALSKICTCVTAPDAYAEQCLNGRPGAGCDAACQGSYKNLETLLNQFGLGHPLEYGCRTPEGEPAVCVDASFTATRIDHSPPECR
jgi:hypothetical protein